MSQSFEEEFEGLLAERQQRTEISLHIDRIIARLQPILEEQGVVFHSPDDEDDWYSDDDQLNARIDEAIAAKEQELGRVPNGEELLAIAESIAGLAERLIHERAERYASRSRLRELATIVAMNEAAGEHSERSAQLDTKFKKQLHARYIVRGYGRAWVDLIDSELPGEPLTDDDSDIIAETVIEAAGNEADSRRWLESQKTQMQDFLAQRGIDEISQNGEIAITIFCGQLGVMKYQNQSSMQSVRFVEDAKRILIDYGLTDDAWFELLDVFFTVL